MTKVCKVCKRKLSIEKFREAKGCVDGHRGDCIVCQNKRSNEHYWNNSQEILIKERENRIADPDVYRAKKLKKLYGITLDQYNKVFEQQGGVCKVCGRPETATRNDKLKHLAVDHNHNTGRVRGLLCAGCNTALGYLSENPVVIKSLLDYIINND